MLWKENHEAWAYYTRYINTQFVYDFQALPLVFNVLQLEMTRREALILLEKLILIHKTIHDFNKEKQANGKEKSLSDQRG